MRGRENFRPIVKAGREAFPVRLAEVRDLVVHQCVDPEVAVVESQVGRARRDL